jgi:hypothetical protein
MKLSYSFDTFAKSIIAVALAASAISSEAGVLVLDDFSQSAAPVWGPPNATGAPTLGTGFWSQRTLSIFDGTGTPTGGAYVLVTQGVLNINDGNLVKATADVAYNFDFDRLNAALSKATYFEITLDQINIDTNSVFIFGSGARVTALNGLSVLLGSGNDLTSFKSPFNIRFRSDFAADSSWDNLKITYTCKKGATAADLANPNAPDDCGTGGVVPIVPSFALLGLGLFGLLANSKRRQA